MIPITKPFLPPLEEYQSFLKGIWERNWLTNNGPLVNELELKLKEFLNVEHCVFVNNGTIALQMAIKALNLTGEIITTPFSFVATSSSISWEGCKPVYVDIQANTLNIDPALIEAKITNQTTAILATHVFGYPCNIEQIREIANKYKLKIIYDAAHCFGTTYLGESLFNYGDISITSFHATKLFHTIEGGALFSKDAELNRKLTDLRNFGFNGPEAFSEVGTNGKNSEFHAAMGLANFKYIDTIFKSRKRQCKHYDSWFTGADFEKLKIHRGSKINYSYYPVIFKSNKICTKLIAELEANKIFPRKYFYPSLNTIPVFNPSEAPVSEDIASRIICMPLYHNLSTEEIDFIGRIVKRALTY